ncbi:MAG TPA: hypothetical protein VFS50_02735 [Meiothermus sp.]|jgi:hypothetical protein|nr:hypothetical protein [Meiothermus sp.]
MEKREHFAVFRPVWLRVTLTAFMLSWLHMIATTARPLWQDIGLWLGSALFWLLLIHAAFSWLEVNGERVTVHLFGLLHRVYTVEDIRQSSIKVWKHKLGTNLLGVTISTNDRLVVPLSLWYTGMAELAGYLMRNVHRTEIH